MQHKRRPQFRKKETGIKTQSISENVSQFDIQIAGINHIVAGKIETNMEQIAL